MGIKDTTISFLLIFIFTISIITFAVGFANNNSTAVNIGDDPDLSGLSSDMESDAITYTTEINGSLKAYADSEVVAGAETLEKGTVFKDKEVSPTNAFKNILDVINKRIFGGDSAFKPIFTALLATILLIGVWYSWKLWKGGNPE